MSCAATDEAVQTTPRPRPMILNAFMRCLPLTIIALRERQGWRRDRGTALDAPGGAVVYNISVIEHIRYELRCFPRHHVCRPGGSHPTRDPRAPFDWRRLRHPPPRPVRHE